MCHPISDDQKFDNNIVQMAKQITSDDDSLFLFHECVVFFFSISFCSDPEKLRFGFHWGNYPEVSLNFKQTFLEAQR